MEIDEVICIDETEGGQTGLKLLTNGKKYKVYGPEHSNHAAKTPSDCYYMIGDDGFPIMPLKIYFMTVREWRNKQLNLMLNGK